MYPLMKKTSVHTSKKCMEVFRCILWAACCAVLYAAGLHEVAACHLNFQRVGPVGKHSDVDGVRAGHLKQCLGIVRGDELRASGSRFCLAAVTVVEESEYGSVLLAFVIFEHHVHSGADAFHVLCGIITGDNGIEISVGSPHLVHTADGEDAVGNIDVFGFCFCRKR